MNVSVGSRLELGAHSRKWQAAFALLLLAFTLLPSLVFAQNSSGTVSAIVADKTGAVIPNAKVVLKNEATTVTRETLTNNAGVFNFAAVQPGTYTVRVSSPGLQTTD